MNKLNSICGAFLLGCCIAFCSCAHHGAYIVCDYIGWQDKPMYSMEFHINSKNKPSVESQLPYDWRVKYYVQKQELLECVSCITLMEDNDSLANVTKSGKKCGFGCYRVVAFCNNRCIERHLTRRMSISLMNNLLEILNDSEAVKDNLEIQLKRLQRDDVE